MDELGPLINNEWWVTALMALLGLAVSFVLFYLAVDIVLRIRAWRSGASSK